jgi:TonB family protein
MLNISARYFVYFLAVGIFMPMHAQQAVLQKIEQKLKGSENTEIFYELDKQKEGTYTLYYKANKQIEGNYVKGKKEGMWVYYNADGKCIIKGNYSNDKKAGEWLYFKNDTLISKIIFGITNPIDTLRGYLPNGKLAHLKIVDNTNPKEPVIIKEDIFNSDSSAFKAEILPEFLNNSSDSFREYIKKIQKYPGDAASEGISGRVYIQFTLNSMGKPENIIILRGLHPSLDREAIRVIETSPNWEPGYQYYLPVKVQFTFPVNFIQ